MALTLSKTGIDQTNIINAWHVSQSVDALTGTVGYDITISGSLDISDSTNTGDLVGTASWAEDAITSSYAESALSSSYAVTASFAIDYTDPTFVDGDLYPSGSVLTPGAPFKFIAGASQTDGLNTATVNVVAINGKTLNQNCFVTATAESSTGNDVITVDPAGIPPNLQFKSTNPNTNFHFQIMYV